MKKECRSAESVRRRNPRKRVVTKTAQLEEKLDGLVSLIRAGALNGASPQNTVSADNNAFYGTIQTNANTPTHGQSEGHSSLSSSDDYIRHTPINNDYTDSLYEPSLIQAEGYLTNFRTCKSKFFPFIHIPSITSAQQLRKERPFLWLCIMANYHTQAKPFLALFTQLAMSLVFDLGINKPVPKDWQATPCGNSRLTTPRTMEERRAVIGCFLITSTVALLLQKIDALRWTPHMDECLQILDERKECPNDDILVQQVRLQLIVEKMDLIPFHDEESAYLYHESLLSQLQDVKKFLNAGFESIKSWFDIFLKITPAAYIAFPFSLFSQLIFCLMTLYRLKSFDDLVWDRNDVWKTEDALLTLDHVIENMEQVAVLAGLDNTDCPEGDVFSRHAKLLGGLRSGWEAKLRPDDLALSAIPSSQNSDDIGLLDPLGMEFFDNFWLMDLSLPSS
ncbi:hypothetical protein B7463_g6109, partial [Scytalidium lignicola]